MTKIVNDLFTEWINKVNTSEWIRIALTDRSFKSKYEKENGHRYEGPINANLATYGDNVLKLALSDLLFDVNDINLQLSEVKKRFESDEFLVTKVARHYDLIKVIIRNEGDEKMADNYDYKRGVSRNNAYKFIATAVEALIGAIYKETKDLDIIISIVKDWMKL